MGCRVRLLAWDRDLKSPARECIEGIEVERVFLRSLHGRGTSQLFFYAWLYLKFLWRGWRSSFDVVHCHDLDTLPLGFVLGKLKRKPVVYDAHESFPDMLAGSVHGVIRGALMRLENFLIRRIDLLITVGRELQRHFDSRGARRSAVVGNWKRLEEYQRPPKERDEIRRRLGVPEEALLVVCITQLLKDRKLEELLDAVDSCSSVYLIIGGKGVLERQVVERAARNARIRYVGFVRGHEIPAYTCAADAVYYGFDNENPNARFSAPNKLFEALAAGRPLITGNFGEIGRVVREASCGIVLDRYSEAGVRRALESLCDPEVRNQYAGNAYRMGRTAMNWAKAEETLYEEYARLLSHTSGRPASPASAGIVQKVEVGR
jgi:glycosyltransferase involved in cell wall biosynthesis